MTAARDTEQTRRLRDAEAVGAGAGRYEPGAPREPRRPEDGDGAVIAEGTLVMDRYRLLRCIGRGGHGTVWQARDERLERDVAVKVIARADGAMAPRAEREGRVAARLAHPAIVALYELGSDDHAVYLVSELVAGRTMADLAAAGGLSDQDVAEIGAALCSALEHAHSQGVIHRDVKPHNVMVVSEPAAGAGFAKLTDFGVAHASDDATLTRTGDVVGTVAFMAPEQAEGAHVTPAADVYSLALVLHQGWTGSRPDGALAVRLAGRPLPSMRSIRPDLPSSLGAVIDAALDPRPELRPGLEEVRAELLGALEQLSTAGGLAEPATRRRLGLPSAAALARTPASPPAWAKRLAAGLAAGALVAAALNLAASSPFEAPPALLAAAAAALVTVLPRSGWLIVAASAVGWVGLGGGLPGTALVLAGALAPVPLLLPRAGLLWSAPALAPLLGAIGLAPLFPALAALASTAWRRAGLAATGFGWLVAAEVLTGRSLLFGVPAGTAGAGAWEALPFAALADAIYPVLVSPALAPALLWAALAVALGPLVRLRSVPLMLGAVTAWAILLVVAHEFAGELLDRRLGRGGREEAVAGAVLGAMVVVAASLTGVSRTRFDRPYVP